VGHAWKIREKHKKFQSETQKGKDYLEGLNIDDRIILKLILKN
jgi:hypothetical protein